MDDAALVRRLNALAPPGLDEARRRAQLAVRGSLAGHTVAQPRRRCTPSRARVAGVLAALCALFAAVALVTPPGHAVTSWVGDRLGFGHPGEHPTLRQLRHKVIAGSAASGGGHSIAAGQAAYVIARGPAPHGDHYEYITYRSNRGGAHCFEIDLPKLRQLMGGSCEEAGFGRLAAEGGFTLDSAGGNGARGYRFMSLAGRVSTDVDAVRVEFDGRSEPVELTEPPAWLLEELGFKRPFKVYMSFPQGTERGGSLKVSALRGGTVVGSEELMLSNSLKAGRHVCHWAQRLADEGKLKERNARRTCRSLK